VLQPIHRWLTDLEHTACGLRRTRGRRGPLVVRGWSDVTCQRCLSSIHAKLEQLQRQPPGSQGAPQGHRRRGRDVPRQRAAEIMPFPARRPSQGRTHR
jgi:hypothetical protein